MKDLIAINRHLQDIDTKRKEISKLFMSKSENIKSGTIHAISAADLLLLFQLYDRVFFENRFMESFQGKLRFSLSRRMTRSAGLTLYPKNIDRIKPEDLTIEIRIGTDFFFHYGIVEGSKTVCGLKTGSSLEALQLVFEHELCHAIEFILYKKSSCRGDRFKTIANHLFGHTESYHKLPTYRQIACQKLGYKIGDTVSFILDGKKMTGILYNINKRATVMVKDKKGILTDKKGTRYSKYYVPLTRLE